MSSHLEPAATEGRDLIDLARLAVREAVANKRLPEAIPQHGVFSEHRGVFVTLHVRGALRGCIGVVEAQRPLGESIVQSAISAAMHDPRFASVRADELEAMQLEVSLLSVPITVRPEEVEIGKHGLLIVSGDRRGLLLPQVAIEHGLNREQFLDETCRKAGLPRGSWRSAGVDIFGFTCEIFSEFADGQVA
jgi:AmmeMemoRadiSam system protein A